MQIFLTTVNPGTYTFPDLGDYTVVHPIGPIPLIEPNGEFYIEDIQLSDNLFAQVTAGNISLTNSSGLPITTLSELTESSALSFNDLLDVDLETLGPQNGDLLYFNGGGNWIPADNATDRVSLFTNGCIAEFQDTLGLDFCNHQIGPAAGSAFYIAKRSLGTIAIPTAVTDGVKIGGYAFLANDGITTGPGYVGAEISSNAIGDQDAVNGGANIWFDVTTQGTKTPLRALTIEDDGTLSVAGQTDYELKVLDDDDIPNKAYIDSQLAVASELPTVAVRRTTSLNPIPTTWTDFDWDTQDVTSSNTSVIDYTGTPADEIQIGEAGLYLISWAISADDEVEVRLTNNGVVIPGSFHTTGDKTDSNQILTGNEKVIARNLNVGTLVLQVEAITTAEFTIADSATFSVVRLKGTKGENGDPGTQGPSGNDGADGADGQDGPPGFGIYAWADVTGATGVENDGLGLSAVRNSTGTYTYTFDQALVNTAYAVNVQLYDAGATDFNSFVNNRTTTGFQVTMGLGDNGGTADVLTDANHTVTVVGPGAGAPSGSNLINVRSDGTPAVNTPHGTLNFSSDFTVADAGGGIVDIGSNLTIPTPIFSVLKTKSQAADQVTNYNINGTEVALILTGTTTTLGDGATDFTNASGTYTCNFTGSVRVTYGVPNTSTGARASLKSVTQQDTGGGFANVGAPSYGYIRNSGGHVNDNNVGSEIFECTTGDQFRVGMRRGEGSTSATAINILPLTFIQIERLS